MHQKCAEGCSLEVSTDEECGDGNCELQDLSDYLTEQCANAHLERLTR